MHAFVCICVYIFLNLIEFYLTIASDCVISIMSNTISAMICETFAFEIQLLFDRRKKIWSGRQLPILLQVKVALTWWIGLIGTKRTTA